MGRPTLRLAFVVPLLLLIPSVMAGPLSAEAESVAIPVPRVGERVEYAGTGTDGLTTWTFTETVEWTTPVHDTIGAYGEHRRAYEVNVTYCSSPGRCSVDTFAFDAGTRDLLSLSRLSGSTSYLEWTGLPGLYAEARGGRLEVRADYLVRGHVQELLLDRVLHVGETVAHEFPVRPGSTASVQSAHFTGIGWETRESGAMFRVESEFVGAEEARTFWFDGERPSPVLAERRYELDGLQYRFTWTSTHHTPGAGALVSDPTYVPTEPGPRVGPVAVYTADGPTEATSSAFPLQNAVSALRADIRAADWFQNHADAYLASGRFAELPSSGRTVWSLRYSAGTRALDATVEAPYSGVGSAPTGVATRVRPVEQAETAYPPRDAVVGRSFVCAAALEEILDPLLDPSTPAVEPVRAGGFRVVLVEAVDLRCERRLSWPAPSPVVDSDAADDDAAAESRTPSAHAVLFGASGGLRTSGVGYFYDGGSVRVRT